ncbi:hypothetical protein MRX96_034313 [Rhipicephalus microplus]
MYHRRRIRNYSLGKNVFLSALRGGVHGSAQNSVLNVFSPPSVRLLAAVFFVFGASCSSRRGFSSPPVADRLFQRTSPPLARTSSAPGSFAPRRLLLKGPGERTRPLLD